MHVLFLLSERNHRALGRQAMLLAKGSHLSARLSLFNLGGPGPFSESLEALEAPVGFHSRNRLVDLEAWRALRLLLRSECPDVLHVFGLTALRALGVATLLAGPLPPIVLSLSSGHIRRNRLNRWERYLLHKVAVATVFTEAERTASITLGFPPEKVRIIPPGVALPEPLPDRNLLLTPLGIPPDGKVILNVGRIEPGRFFHSYWAFDILRYTDPQLYWLQVGAGPGRANLEQRIRATAGSENPFRFAGARPDAAQWPQLAEVVWVPLADEGGTFTLLEGMAAGRPVVATDLPHLRAVIREGETGLLVPPGNPVALAAATRKLLLDTDLRERLGTAARAEVSKRYSLEAMVEAYEELYRSLLGSGPDKN